MPSPDLSHRERVLWALDGKPTDRVPIAMVCSGINEPARTQLDHWLRRQGRPGVDAWLSPLIDIEGINLTQDMFIAEGYDMWGVRRAPMPQPSGGFYMEIDFYPLAEAESPADLARHAWPRPEQFRYDEFLDRARGHREGRDPCLMLANGNVFETAWYMRGLENMMMDFLVRPELAHALLDRVADFYIELFDRALGKAGRYIDLVFTADDVAGQEGLLMSLPMWEEFIKPRHARLNRLIHQYGKKIIYHSDGAVMDVVPGFIDMGIDILQALQFDARGMDPVRLKNEYGHQLAFEGGISVQRTLPFGSAEDVAAEVRERVAVLAKGGKYILGPSHAIQAGTPPENIAALFDTAAGQAPG